jgi:ubiquinone/menaquinone biosynthesis C-methylase UbiE
MYSQSTAGIQQFFDGQNIYGTVITENYMKHREIIQWIGDRCLRFGNRGIRILEAGCGDAYVVSQLTQSIKVESYVGIDLAENSLRRARILLEPHVRHIELIQGDFAEEIRPLKGAFDLILGGYVVHHLLTPEKKKVFEVFHKLLKDDGVFIIYDVTKKEEESRDSYNNRTLDYYNTHWTALTAELLDGVRRHVTTYDFPESQPSWIRLAQESGFKLSASEYLDKEQFFCIMEFRRTEFCCL